MALSVLQILLTGLILVCFNCAVQWYQLDVSSSPIDNNFEKVVDRFLKNVRVPFSGGIVMGRKVLIFESRGLLVSISAFSFLMRCLTARIW